jgi:Neurotransmitter-gated ion-channel ligand binding domain
MKNRIRFTVILLLLSLLSFAQKDSCKVGIYINCIYDFKLDEKSFMVDFWMWMNYKNDSLDFQNNQDITNSKSSEFTHFTKEKKNGINWAAQKCKAQIMHQWDVSNFPFDRQKLRIEIEDAENDTTSMIYVADSLNSKLDPCFVTAEWDIESFTIKDQIKSYATNYGNPLLSGSSSSYPQVVAEISIKRNHSWLLLMKLLTGAYVAFLISSLVFLVSSKNQDSRFGLCVGGLFAAIGNKYITESVVPATNANTLMDNVHNLTFGFILLIVIISIITLRLYQSENKHKVALSIKIDRISFWCVLMSYTVINVSLVIFALCNN